MLKSFVHKAPPSAAIELVPSILQSTYANGEFYRMLTSVYGYSAVPRNNRLLNCCNKFGIKAASVVEQNQIYRLSCAGKGRPVNTVHDPGFDLTPPSTRNLGHLINFLHSSIG
ncbi:hypothetical protein GWI33_011963 [Rhynchophorus ferrugineus]|uniref:Uncharacterized protein n=1 Tax=Rhynchophorus ferrugineus TaxID=354439 RepID=A0A834IU68_RHYFE|nr:hypothetical protein GWI33_011963 [Rhynchophorus ferrugineus]